MSIHRLIILLLLGWITASAQEPAEAPPDVPAEAPPGVPVPGVAPAPAGAPAVKPATNLGETKIIEDIIEPKLSGNALAGLYRKYTGRRVIVSTAAAAAEFSFVQDATAQDPLTYAEAAELLRKAAVLENFVFVEHPQDANLDILTLATGGPRPTNVDISVFNENTPLPDTDVVITYVMSLSHIKPDQALNIFTQVIGQFGAYGSIAAVPNASAVVITEKASLIRSLVDLQKTIDVPGSVQSTRFIKVQYADVTEIASVLTDLLTAQQGAQSTAGVQRTNVGEPPGAPGGAPAGSSSGGGGEDTPVQIIPEPRTNRIFAMGRPVDLIFVEGLIREFDIPTSDKTFLRRKLRFLTVSEFLPIAGDALTRAFTGTGEGGSGGASGGTSGSRSQGSSRQSASGNNRANQTSSGFGGGNQSSGFGGSSSGFGGSGGGFGGSSSGRSGSSGGGSALGDSNVSAAPESLLVGRTLLVADNITNTVVVQGPPSGLEIVERLLDQLDVKPDQVMISTVIGQLSLTNNKDTGVGYLFRGGDINAGGGGGLPIIPILDELTPENLSALGLSSSGLRAYGTVGDLSIYLKALQSKTDFRVLSRPSIFTSNNQKGTISSGERIAIPTNSNNFSGGGSSTNIEYQDVVLKLEVIPLVNSNNEITMQIALLSDEQNGSQTISGAGGNGEDLVVPRITTREILTTATVPNNNTIVLGGLIVGRNGEDKSGIPILSDIPYLGRLFSTTKDNDDRSELMIFIQPSIVNSDRSLSDVQNDMDSRYKISGDVRAFGDGPGVLPPVDEIPRVVEKGKGGASPRSASTAQPAATNTAVKPSLRPAHRR
ncbi:MAG: secretin N-terminal domain-containing protein [Luteolibacter sp.]|nr:secretin N-terminal domain-containing protein [Luteolibacter sp.]